MNYLTCLMQMYLNIKKELGNNMQKILENKDIYRINIFATLNHIGIVFKDDYCPKDLIEKVIL